MYVHIASGVLYVNAQLTLTIFGHSGLSDTYPFEPSAVAWSFNLSWCACFRDVSVAREQCCGGVRY